MNSTQGVIEALNKMFWSIEAKISLEDAYLYQQPLYSIMKILNDEDSAAAHQMRYQAIKETFQPIGMDTMQAGTIFVVQFGIAVNDYIKREDFLDEIEKVHRPKVYKPLTPAAVRKYAGMDTADFAQLLYDICTDKGRKITPDADKINGYKSPDLFERCIYAAYVYSKVAAYLDYQNSTFLPVPMPAGIMQLPFINSGIKDIDENTGNGTITVGDTTFRVKKGLREVSTGALMLMLYLLHKARSTRAADLTIPLREYAEIKKRSTSKQALQKLKAEILAQMEELAVLGYDALFRTNGKQKSAGNILINGGTHFIENGNIRWNFNQSIYNQLMIYAPTDTPLELFAADPRTSTFYFGVYIAQNWRINEGKPGRNKIPMRTLTEKSPNLPTYEEVIARDGHISTRIIKKTFADLDALDTVFYDFYTNAGERIENPENLDYQTFINGYILIDYTEYPQHPDRVKKKREREKKLKAAKEKGQLIAAQKAAEREQAE